MNFANINDNIISKQWKDRYDGLTQKTKVRIDELKNQNPINHQLQVIKKTRVYPKIGDMFILKPTDSVQLRGIVVNNHINNLNGDDLLLILIFNDGVDIECCIKKVVTSKDLLIRPAMVGKEYWIRGYFSTINNIDIGLNFTNIGFYSVMKKKILNEYGKEILVEPELLGIYGVSTITGIGLEVKTELIIKDLI